jgi:dihydroxyacetone kinase DhaKLM complex PTS-EIIA-like component DhaM
VLGCLIALRMIRGGVEGMIDLLAVALWLMCDVGSSIAFLAYATNLLDEAREYDSVGVVEGKLSVHYVPMPWRF